MTKLWNVYLNNRYIGSALNEQSEGMHRDQPKMVAVADMLPHYLRRMDKQVWHCTDGDSVTIRLVRKNGHYHKASVLAMPYDH